MATIEGGGMPKISSWLYSSHKVRSPFPAVTETTKWVNEEGGARLRLFGPEETPETTQNLLPASQSSGHLEQSTQSPALSSLEPSEGLASSTIGDAQRDTKWEDLDAGSLEDDQLPQPAENPSRWTYTFRVPEEAWRETQPEKELYVSTGQQFFDFCDSPYKGWARGESQPANLFGPPIAPDAPPIPRKHLPPRLFDLLYGRTVSTESLLETSYTIVSHVWGTTTLTSGEEYGVRWDVPVSSRDKLTKMLEFARFVGGERYVWVDILCMDQSRGNEEEIPRMRSYYTNASACLVWLEKADNDDKASWTDVLEALRYFNSLYNLDAHSIPTITPQDLLNGELFKLKIDGREGYQITKKLLALEKASWFKSVWTLQSGVIPETLAFCTPEKYMTRGANFFWVVSMCAMVADVLLKQGDPGGMAILNCLQNSETWKIFRLRQLYRKRQVSFWHIVQATKSRTCLREQDRVYGVLGLAQGASIKVDYNRPPAELLQDFFVDHLVRGDFATLLYSASTSSIAYDPSSRGFLLSGALACERRESHKVTLMANKMLRLQDVGIDGVKQRWPLLSYGDLQPWAKQFPELANLNPSDAVDVCRAWELDIDSFPEDSRFMAIFTITAFGRPIEFFETVFRDIQPDLLDAYHVSLQRALITWSSIGTVIGPSKDYAIVVLWTYSCGPVLAVLNEMPKTELYIVTPSSYVDNPGEGFLLVTRDPQDTCLRKIGVGVSTKVKPAQLDTITLLC